MNARQILLKYWGFPSFRPLQEEIIQSVLDGKDTLALLPTGGGKSLTYQIPALAKEGLCLVISPLIALMKDQVDNLKKRGIPAAAIHSGMHSEEIRIVLNNARFGEYKLLYCSPERLGTEIMQSALQRIKINLLAVDEAHCISQWGYDFRPPYLRIAEIRPFLPGVPILALTATATQVVVSDIQKNLGFPRENVFRAGFERKNLTYFVFREEDKRSRLEKIIRKVKGCGVIYVRNRKETREIANFLVKKGIQATHYHAGLTHAERMKRQNEWMQETKPVMVATNAFGMGIDKPNVRFVIHLDLPDSLEAYFQEAGRAGRDGKRSFAVLLFEKADVLDARHNLAISYPEIQKIKIIYNSLGNFLKIPAGSGKDVTFPFDITDFSERVKLSVPVVFNALKILEKEGYLILSEAIHIPSRIHFPESKETLYRFQVENASFDPFIKLLLRSYSGVFSDFVAVNENELARRSGIPAAGVISMLRQLARLGAMEYVEQTDLPQITYLEPRFNPKDISLSPDNYMHRVRDATRRLEAVIRYAESRDQCRSQALLNYFGDGEARRCGKCDTCIERNKMDLNDMEFGNIREEIREHLAGGPLTLRELAAFSFSLPTDKMIRVLQWLADNGEIIIDEEGRYSIQHLYY